jgi:hypothetical protein
MIRFGAMLRLGAMIRLVAMLRPGAMSQLGMASLAAIACAFASVAHAQAPGEDALKRIIEEGTRPMSIGRRRRAIAIRSVNSMKATGIACSGATAGSRRRRRLRYCNNCGWQASAAWIRRTIPEIAWLTCCLI